MSATLAEALGDSLALLAERDALTLAQQNYRSVMLSSLLACQLRSLVNASAQAAVERWETAQDVMAGEIGTTVLDMRRQGASDRDALDGVMALVQLRMITSLDDAVGELAGGETA